MKMKARVQTAPELLRQVDSLLAARHTSAASVLDELAELLSGQRRYEWIGIYLAAGPASEPDVSTLSQDERPASRHVAPIRLAARTLGAIEVRSSRPNAFSYKDRVLLTQIATKLARYLATSGKPLLRKLRAAAEASPETQGVQRKPATKASAAELRAATAGSTPHDAQMRRAVGAPSRRA
jgi:putative methionine-R-sulfoxide reductase with GAF domain